MMPCERPSCRSLGLVSKKPRAVGRPKLPKGHAKARIVPVRFKVDDLRRIATAAKASNQTISEWIRSRLNAAIGYPWQLTESRII